MDVAHVHIQPGEHGHGLFHGVGDVVELQVQEYLMAPGLYLPDYLRALGIVELHAYLHKGLALFELVQEAEHLLRTAEIAGNDNVFTHVWLLLLYLSVNLYYISPLLRAAHL